MLQHNHSNILDNKQLIAKNDLYDNYHIPAEDDELLINIHIYRRIKI